MKFKREHFVNLTRLLGKGTAALAVALVAASCTVAPPPVHPVPPGPPPPNATWLVDAVACASAGAVPFACETPIAGATIQMHGPDGYISKPGDGAGYAVFTVPVDFPDSDVIIDAPGYVTARAHIDVAGTHDSPRHNIITLTPDVPPLPAPPTRDEILNLHITFQGLYCDTQQFGRLPWFEAALPWLTPGDRARCYAAKHASPAWGPGGDTHALINLPSGPPLYDEPGQPYSADHFPALDWTAGGTHIDGRLADLVAEVARAGFNRQLLFLGGDDGPRGFPIAMNQLDLAYQALRVESKYGDLGPFVIPLPGYDGVFYGYSPDQVAQWGAKCRQLFLYCGIEHQPGRIPVGEGGGDYLPGGRMTFFDLILAEFDGPNDSAWRAHLNGYDSRGNPDYNGNQIWQVGIRMLGSDVYRHPSDQPADADKYTGGSYLAPGSPRGPFVHCAFEWVGEYNFVRGRESAADEQRSREYFKSAGWSCGG